MAEQDVKADRVVVLMQFAYQDVAPRTVDVFDVPVDWSDEDVERFVQDRSAEWMVAAVTTRQTALPLENPA